MCDVRPDLTPDQWEAVLNLLGAIVLTDRDIECKEVTAVWCALQDLCGEAGLRPSFSRNQIAAWIGVRAFDILDAIEGDAPDDWVEDHLITIRGSDRRAEVFRALETAMLSDHSVCDRQFDGILMASAILGQDPSRRISPARPRAVSFRSGKQARI